MDEKRGVLLQYFHWYTEADGSLWTRLAKEAKRLAEFGFTAVWLPPAYKGAAGGYDTGYGVYDLYDLGEFDQKGSIRTKYGTKDEYVQAIEVAHTVGLQIYADIVLNHRMGADAKEVVKATAYPRNDRNTPKGALEEIEAYTRFTFDKRAGRYSDFTWSWHHFDAVDHNARNPEDNDTIFVFEGKQFDDYVSGEFGNYDYLMGADLDFGSQDVADELARWGRWYLDTTGVDGFRIDAVKHIPSWFFPPWLTDIDSHAEHTMFFVAEYWDPDVDALSAYTGHTEGKMSLFDVPLHFKFHQAGIEHCDFDLSTIFEGTYVERDPNHAVTFVANHDSQALQALESVVESWFKPLAYALILLRREGYPCVFIADYEGATYRDRGNDGNEYTIEMPSFKKDIDTMLNYRKTHTFGEQYDYFDHSNTIGWSFCGDSGHPNTMAVIMSNGEAGEKRMATGKPNSVFIDMLGNCDGEVTTDADGFAVFRCCAESVSLWATSH
jgi:alpha-amylase